MALSPDQVESQEFRIVWRGADRHEVSAFLKRVATDVRELEARLGDAKTEVEEAKRSKEAAIAAAAQLPVPPALTTPVEHENSDRFNELGDRIAGLLRTAEESADNIRLAAEEEAAEIKAEAAQLLEQANADAEKIRSDATAEVSNTQKEVERARARLDEELESTRMAADDDRSSAQSALAEAKAAVSELLAEARSQSEFIRHEADEIVRVKVRTEMETAEKRMRILQLTEQSSRDRLVSAQAELTAALDKLQSDPMPELDLVEPDAVLDEARDRATRELTGGGKASPFGVNSLDEVFEPQFYEDADDVDDSSGTESDSSEPDVDAADLADTAGDDEWASPVDEVPESAEESAEDDGSEEWARAAATSDVDEADEVVDEADEVVDEAATGVDRSDGVDETADEETADEDVAEVDEAAGDADEPDEDVAEGDEAAGDAGEADEAVAEVHDAGNDAEASEHEDGYDAQAIMDDTPGVVIEDSISTVQDDTTSPLVSVEVPDDSGELLEDAMAGARTVPPPPQADQADAVPAALKGSPPPPPAAPASAKAVEDPLARLVREAMQRAVDSARGDDL